MDLRGHIANTVFTDSNPIFAKTTNGKAHPWVIVAGGFHDLGGMDKANSALARYLLEQNVPVHLVGHRISDEFRQSGATIHLVPRPLNSYLLGEQALDFQGRQVARKIKSQFPNAIVVANGGNCLSADVNWVHSVHHAWPPVLPENTPFWFRAKEGFTKGLSRRRELRAIRRARLVIANSERTRRDIIEFLKVDPSRIVKIYLGADPNWTEVTPEERLRARAWLKLEANRKVIVFVGALGHDQNKGLDTLWAAWSHPDFLQQCDCDLVIAGGGRGLQAWRARIEASGLAPRVRVIGFSDRVRDVLAASDLLVSPVHYEAFGLNVHEAICRGVPAIVTASAGIAELYPADLSHMLLPDANDRSALIRLLLRWNFQRETMRQDFLPLGQQLRAHTWKHMAREIVDAVGEDVSSSRTAFEEVAGCAVHSGK